MAVEGKILDKIPKTERILWSQFEEIQSAFIYLFMTLREINLQSKVVSGRPMNQTLDWQHLPETSRPAPPTLAVAATAVTPRWAGQPGESARSSPSPSYKEGSYMSGTEEDLYWDPSTNDDFYAEEDWDSSGVQIADSSDSYDYDDYSYHDEYEDDFRMLADDPAAEVTVSLVVTQPEGSIGWDRRPPSSILSQHLASKEFVRLGAGRRRTTLSLTVPSICLLT
jgi:hypothetical protein